MPVVTSVALILIGGVLCLLLLRSINGTRYLAVILLTSYFLRVALSVGFYLVSAYEVPIFRSLQLPDGFWRFTYDAPAYHVNGARIAEALRSGAELPQVMVAGGPFIVETYEFFYFVGLVYWILGAHPLYIPLLNCILWIAIPVLGYSLARRMQGGDAGSIAAVLLSLWPSSFIWASQILKDSLIIFLLFSSLYLVVKILDDGHWRTVAIAGVVLAPVVFLLSRMRFYLIAALILAAAGSLGASLTLRFRELRWAGVFRALTLLSLLWLPFVAGRSIDPIALLSPAPHDVAATKSPLVGAEEDSRVTTGQSPSPHDVAATKSPLVGAKEDSGMTTNQSGSSYMENLRDGSRLLHRSIELALQAFQIGNINTARKGYAGTGGTSSFATDVRFREAWDLVLFLPRGLAYALYAPFPWEWFSLRGDTGVFKAFAGIETVLMIALTPFLLVGAVLAVGSRRADAWIVLLFSVIILVALALAVTNVGILFRLRLQFLMPLFILAAAYGFRAETVRQFFAWFQPRSC